MVVSVLCPFQVVHKDKHADESSPDHDLGTSEIPTAWQSRSSTVDAAPYTTSWPIHCAGANYETNLADRDPIYGCSSENLVAIYEDCSVSVTKVSLTTLIEEDADGTQVYIYADEISAADSGAMWLYGVCTNAYLCGLHDSG